MVTISRAGASALLGLAAAREALAGLSKPRPKTDAEQRLDQVLTDLKSQKKNAGKEAARRKLDQIKAKLEALKLAAASASASGNPRAARQVARDIRDAARELGKAMAAAGEGGVAVSVPSAPAAATAAPAAAAEQADAAGADVEGAAGDAAGGAEDNAADNAADRAADDASGSEETAPVESAAKAAGEQVKASITSVKGGDDGGLSQLKAEAASIAKQLKAILHTLRNASALHKRDGKDRGEDEKAFREAEQEIGTLETASAQTASISVAGGPVDISA